MYTTNTLYISQLYPLITHNITHVYAAIYLMVVSLELVPQ